MIFSAGSLSLLFTTWPLTPAAPFAQKNNIKAKALKRQLQGLFNEKPGMKCFSVEQLVQVTPAQCLWRRFVPTPFSAVLVSRLTAFPSPCTPAFTPPAVLPHFAGDLPLCICRDK